MTNVSRRSFLRGASAAIALPAMTSLLPAKVMADGVALGTTANQTPLRAAFIYFPNGAIPKAWWPEEKAGDFTLSQTLSPLEPVKSSFQVLKGFGPRAG